MSSSLLHTSPRIALLADRCVVESLVVMRRFRPFFPCFLDTSVGYVNMRSRRVHGPLSAAPNHTIDRISRPFKGCIAESKSSSSDSPSHYQRFVSGHVVCLLRAGGQSIMSLPSNAMTPRPSKNCVPSRRNFYDVRSSISWLFFQQDRRALTSAAFADTFVTFICPCSSIS